MKKLSNDDTDVIFLVIISVVMAYLVFLVSCVTYTVHADTIDMYTSPSDKTKTVIVYCPVDDHCESLAVKNEDLSNDYEKIEKWANDIQDKSVRVKRGSDE